MTYFHTPILTHFADESAAKTNEDSWRLNVPEVVIIAILTRLFKCGRGTGGREAEELLLNPLRGYFIVRIHMNRLTHHKMPSHHIDEKYDK